MPVPTPGSNSDVACSDWCAESVTFHRVPIFVSWEVLNIKNKKCLKLPQSNWDTILSCNFCAILSPNYLLPHVKDGFRTRATGFRILWKWDSDSGFQSLGGFGIPWPVFRIPQAKISLIPESGFPYTVHGARFTSTMSTKYILLFIVPFSSPFSFPYCWFVRDVTAATLVVKNKSISLLWKLNTIFM